ncbi:type IV pilus modification PilV family protein [Sporomusa malonica]|uniref:Prepilin-type N-terminal cleavage/methylation domain-containing protein n=1 Tax=Sporomusa malonica TaxID=112901 RepID=A0A1W2E9G3_9FIRM|nr:type II secretion system protein [Sporomusa malonica]SMD06419.1 hypothetical protein SAMN04488500_12272 [Sporomusa malonica]
MQNIRCQKGFLMVDILVAIVIISVAIVAIGGLFIQVNKSATTSADYTFAANLAQRQFELLKKKYTANEWAGLDLSKDIPWQGDEKDRTNSAVTFNVTTHASEYTPKDSTDVAENLIELTVTVSWTKQNKSHIIPFTTLFSKK